MIKRTTLSLYLIAVIACAQLVFGTTAQAINAASFDPGRIIDDGIFYDPGGMGSITEVQNFLNAHVPACDTQGTGASGYGSLTNAQYAQQVLGWPGPPYVCLNNYYENPTTGATSFENGGGAFAGGISAAQIIYDSAQQYKINPKVLLVMLRKESLNLFSDSWPLKSQYKYAMGYACPDSGPNYSAACVSSKAGFYNQVNLSAWQLRYYYDNMGSYNFAPGRWNTIQYNPDPGCGTKDVYIQNYATASLYVYTPYTPNDAALNAYPGQAACGAYGNRNFWFFWQEWFGSPLLNGNFLRSVNDATVYLVGDKMKYPISDAGLLNAASVLGGVGYVSQTYLDNIPTGTLLGRNIQSPDGTNYFYDANIKLPFSTCAMVTNYGSACGSAALLTQAQIDKFVNGPAVTNGMKTTSGKTFYMINGTKREVFDDDSLRAASLAVPGYNMLNENAFDYLAYGMPFVRTDTIVKNRQDSTQQYLLNGAVAAGINTSQTSNTAFSTLPIGLLDSSSVQKLEKTTAKVDDYIKDEQGSTYVLSYDGKRKIADTQGIPVSILPTQLNTTLVGKLKGSGYLTTPALARTSGNSTVYALVNGEKRPLVAMEDLASLTGETSPYIAWLSGGLLDQVPTGNIIIGAGRLVKTPSSATVYMTDGYDKLIPMSSFISAYDLGLNLSIRTISDSILSKYVVTWGPASLLSSYAGCGVTNYIGMGGIAYSMTIAGATPRQLSPETCNTLRKNTTPPRFLRVQNGTIYELRDGTVYPISSWSTYMNLRSTGSTATVDVSYDVISLLPKGPLL